MSCIRDRINILGFKVHIFITKKIIYSLIFLLVLRYMMVGPYGYSRFGRMVLDQMENIVGKEIYNHRELQDALAKSTNFSTISINTTCSEEVALLGNHQKVISYSYSGSNSGYIVGINQILTSIAKFYPGWTVRIYATGKDIIIFKLYIKRRDFVYFCDIDHLPPPIYTGRPYPVTLWRYAPLGDPQIDLVLFRDMDSDILRREYDAVKQWLASNKTLHIMRDHPHHNVVMLAGMYGIKMTEDNRKVLQKIRDVMFDLAYASSSFTVDQYYLKKVFWATFEKDSFVHDSYTCKLYPGSSPWPSQRDAKRSFVGAPIFRFPDLENLSVGQKCPLECRPKNHTDWEYC